MLSILAGFLILVMFLYGGYSLWDTARIYGNAAVGEELLKYKPTSETEGEHSFAAGTGFNQSRYPGMADDPGYAY